MLDKLEILIEKAKTSELSEDDALGISTSKDNDLAFLMAGADTLRRRRFGNQVQLCSIVNAKSGRCDQDCSFCAQSSHHRAEIDLYEFMAGETILSAARSSQSNRATEFSIVTSGKGLRGKSFNKAVESIGKIGEIPGLRACASVGVLSIEKLAEMKDAGLSRYHHNLETARSYYPEVCSTRDYDENVETLKNAQRAGLKVCSGGIFGMGESVKQRVELAFELKALEVDSVPINFLHPIPGTPMENRHDLTPMECLRIITLFSSVRFVSCRFVRNSRIACCKTT